MNSASTASQLAQLIVDAQRGNKPITAFDPELVPADSAAAYETQQEILRQRGVSAGGWKIGSKSHTGPVQGSPLPSDCLLASASQVERAGYSMLGLELEVAFRLNRDFTPRDTDYSDAEVLAGIGEIGATIELVSSRYAQWPKIEPLAQLADLLNHGALVVGEFIPYRDDFDFMQPTLSFTLDGNSIAPSVTGNPAGDPRRLLTWLVNHHTGNGQTLSKGLVITAGSYTGMHFAEGPGQVLGQIEGLPPVSVTLI
ncbi:MAG: 2-keto-4-pentenoate hydratase [Pseudomonas sp.]|nr:2-keto-4-pentenoate hydratase [Pseudomonas sp.]